MIELVTISQQVEDKDLHRVLPRALWPALLAASIAEREGRAGFASPSWTT
jgi:hypothetical protein